MTEESVITGSPDILATIKYFPSLGLTNIKLRPLMQKRKLGLQQLPLLMKLLENSPKIAEIESRLAKYTFLSRTSLPGYLDGTIFQALKKTQKYPDRGCNPHFYHWYILMRQFAEPTIKKWIQDALYYDPTDNNIEHAIDPPLHTLTRTSHKTHHQSTQDRPADEQGSCNPEPKETQYTIDILLKQHSEEIVARLARCLQRYHLQIVSLQREVRIKGGCVEENRQEIVNLISGNVEYENLQVKKCRRSKLAYNGLVETS